MTDFVKKISLPWQRVLVTLEFVWRHSIAQTRKIPVIRKVSRGYLLYWPSYSRFCLKFCCLLKFDWYHLVACPGEPPVRRKRLGDISYTRKVKGDFVLTFVAMATGLVVVEFVWHYSIAVPRTPPTRRKRHRDFFYTSGIIARFVSNFVAMATGVGRGRICLASFNSPSPKTPCYTQRSPGISLIQAEL